MKTVVTMVRGDTKEISFQVFTRFGTPMDMAQAGSITFTVKTRRSDDDEDALIRKELSDGVAITNSLNGEVLVTIEPEDTSGFQGKKSGLQWDLQMVTLGGAVFTLADGLLRVNEDVTRDN